VRKQQYTGLRQFFPKLVERVIAALCPQKRLALVCQLVNWSGNRSEILDKPLIIRCKTQKPPEFCHITKSRPAFQRVHFSWVSGHSRCPHDMAQKPSLSRQQVAFLWVQFQSSPADSIEHFPQTLQSP